jgi:hypothetical protein
MVEQDLIGAYFESNGFLVRQATIATLATTKKKLNPLPVLAVMNPRATSNDLALNTRLYSADLAKIRFASVAILGWGNSSFSPASLSSDAQLIKYFKQEIDESRIKECFSTKSEWSDAGIGDSLRILVVPALPSSIERLTKLYQMFEGLEVDGVLTLRSILENLLRQSQPAKSYEGREVLQLLRLVKAYGLSKDPQLEIFQED